MSDARYPGISAERQKALMDSFLKGSQPIADLLAGKGALKGADAQTLRNHFSSYGLHPADCKDFAFAAALMTANLVALKKRWNEDGENAKQIWEDYRDSPNKLPCYDILQVGAFTELSRSGEISEKYFVAAEWMIGMGISVDGTDVAGYTALQHSLSCISLVKSFRWSTMLLNANPNSNQVSTINARNRFGATAMHEAVMSMRRPGETDLRGEVLDWLLEHHANCDIPDNDGTSARTTAKHTPGFREKMEEWDVLVTEGFACQFCRRGKVDGKGKKKAESIPGELRANLRCSACRLVSYCSAECQKMDWRGHKSKCVQK